MVTESGRDRQTPASDTGTVPRHVAIIMDGNGRWAEQRGQPRHAGHQAGVHSVRAVVEESLKRGVQILTLFAFSSENWRRPESEVNLLMELFISALQRELEGMLRNRIQLKVLGDTRAFPQRLQDKIAEAERLTARNAKLILQVAANYGGRWDIAQAARRLAEQVQRGELDPAQIDAQRVGDHIMTAGQPEPDLFIRTGGEKRISNFLLWQIAYAELYFTDCLWPDFDSLAFANALRDFAGRQRRFGRTGAQLAAAASASA